MNYQRWAIQWLDNGKFLTQVGGEACLFHTRDAATQWKRLRMASSPSLCRVVRVQVDVKVIE